MSRSFSRRLKYLRGMEELIAHESDEEQDGEALDNSDNDDVEMEIDNDIPIMSIEGCDSSGDDAGDAMSLEDGEEEEQEEFEPGSPQALDGLLAEMMIERGTAEEDEEELEPEHDNEDDLEPEMVGRESEEDPEEHFNVFCVSVALFCESVGISRRHYKALKELFDIVQRVPDLNDSLPASLDTLKKRLKKWTPSLPLKSQDVPLTQQKLQSTKSLLPSRSVSAPVYYFDPIELFKRLVQSQSFLKDVHVGAAVKADQVKDIHEADSWGSTIRCSSGDLPRYAGSKEPLFPSDFVTWTCSNSGCTCNHSVTHMGRVTWVGKAQSTWHIRMQQVLIAPPVSLNPPILRDEVFPREWDIIETSAIEHLRRIDVFMDWNWGLAPSEMLEAPQRTSNQLYHCRRILRAGLNKDMSVVPLWQSMPLRADLELLKHGGREGLKAMMFPEDKRKVISIPYILFNDGFGLYRNMYRTLMGMYISMAGMAASKRKSRRTMYTLTLGPHAANFNDVVKAISSELRQLDSGVDLEVGGAPVRIIAFPICVTGDMPQQNVHAGIPGPTGDMSCRFCLATAKDRADLRFDFIAHGRYPLEDEIVRKKMGMARTQAAAEKLRKNYGLSVDKSPILQFSPAINTTTFFPTDAAHSELKGIGCMMMETFLAMLTPAGQREYSQIFLHFPVPSGWTAIQAPLHHLKSFQIQEYGKVSIINPILLRLHLEPHWILDKVRRALAIVFLSEDVNPSDADINFILIKAFALIAESNCLLTKQIPGASNKDRVYTAVIQGRETYQKLLSALIMGTGVRNADAARVDMSREGTPAVIPGRERKTYKHSEELERKKGRPNIHIGLHYRKVVEEYGCAGNVTVLTGEDKHRVYKDLVTRTNKRNVEKTLLEQESLRLTLALVLDGAFAEKPQLKEKLTEASILCPTSAKTFYSPDMEEGEEEDSAWMGDDGHIIPCARVAVTTAQGLRRLGLESSKMSKINGTFLDELRDAYRHYPRATKSMSAGRLIFYEKVTFGTPERRRRTGIRQGDFVELKDKSFGIVSTVFTHTGADTPCIFLSIIPFREVRRDVLLQVPILGRTAGSRIIVGLPMVANGPLYTVPIQGPTHSMKQRVWVATDTPELGIQHGDEWIYQSWTVDFM